jgi:phosphoserine phosphatase
MKYVLTLIGKELTAETLRRAAAALQGAGAPAWLAPGEAADLRFAGPLPEAARRRLAEAFSGLPLDMAVQPADGRRRRLLIADMDSTIITVECIDEMADMLGLKPRIAAITARAMAGELDFAAALKERVAMLKGLTLADLERVYDERVRLTPGARELVQTMRAHGAHTALVSGGFDFFTKRVAAAAGFDEETANRLRLDGERLDGTVQEPIVDAASKLATLRRLTRAHGLTPNATMAVGDGANDLQMIRAAGLGVAFHGKPALARAAPVAIRYADLTALLYLQGYRRDEFRR